MAVDALQEKVDAFLRSRRQRPRIFDVPNDLRPSSQRQGYEVLKRVHRALAASGEQRTGFKVACTTDATRRAMGTDSPAYAGLFEADAFPTLSTAIASQSGRTGYECELAVRLGGDLEACPGGWRDALPFVDAVAVACEIVVNRYGDPHQLGLPSLIADDWFQAGYLLGPWVPCETAPKDLSALLATVQIDKSEPTTGWSRDVMGHPLASVAWLAEALQVAGDSLRVGDLVLTGSIVPPIWLDRTPSSLRMSIEGVGTLQFK